MKSLILAAATIAAVSAMSVYDLVLDEWHSYKINEKRRFRSSDDEYDSLKIYLETKELVAKHNEKYAEGLVDYTISLNKFADTIPIPELDEDSNVTTRFMMESAALRHANTAFRIKIPDNVSLPDSVDWNQRGAVAEVQNQQYCGSCYAFTTAATMEAQIFIKHKVLSRLSVQQILDCTKDYGNEGCGGGTFGKTFRYLQTTGLTSDHLYPYDMVTSECRLESKPTSDKVNTYYYMYDGDEEKLKYAVATYGPVAVGVNASPRTFQLYTSGVYTDPDCDKTLVHAVLLVGYGTDPKTNRDFWLIKNSWGPDWGENGYIRLARNMNNLCGIGTLAYVPTI